MPNSLVTTSKIAKEAALILRTNNVMFNRAYKDKTADFQPGDGGTVNIRRKHKWTATQFNGTINIQEASESTIPITIDHAPHVAFKVTSRDLSLNIADFNEQFLKDAMDAVREDLNQYLMKKVCLSPFIYNGAFPTTYENVVDVRSLASKLKMPLDQRFGVVDPVAAANLLKIDTFVKAMERGSGTALDTGEVGHVLGIDWFESMETPTHENGSACSVAGAKVKSNTAVGAATVTITAATSGLVGKAYKQGDILTIASDTTYYSVTADCAADENGDIAVPIYPALKSAASADAAITAKKWQMNFLMHPYALSVACPPLPDLGDAGCSCTVFNEQGVSVRVTMQTDINTLSKVVVIDSQLGAVLSNPELAIPIPRFIA